MRRIHRFTVLLDLNEPQTITTRSRATFLGMLHGPVFVSPADARLAYQVWAETSEMLTPLGQTWDQPWTYWVACYPDDAVVPESGRTGYLGTLMTDLDRGSAATALHVYVFESDPRIA